ncbi:UNVERIFIED_CONTAM: hypothetical protein Scaly_1540900 [Sesamum calycinum]|uniref:Uncharacterized protein n=1 Tax=Sesamum calycinum TaxID=2727403 RepID=A0AAW2P914_9LAMI
MAVEGKYLLPRPKSWKDGPHHPKSEKFYHFRNDYDHTTEEFWHLKNEIEKFIQNGYLQEYVCWKKARGTGPYQKREDDKAKEAKAPSPDSFLKECAKHASSNRVEANDSPPKGVIRMIVGGPVRGDYLHARKAQFREAHDISLKEELDGEAMEDTPLIQFGRTGKSGQKTPHNNTLVITALLVNYEMQRDTTPEKVNTSLYALFGEVVHPQGMISLPLPLGTQSPKETCMLKFLVVDVSSAYNAILGRLTLNAFQALISTYHMKIKFSAPGGVGEVQEDPV